MIKKSLSLAAALLMTAGLTACNMNDDNGANNRLDLNTQNNNNDDRTANNTNNNNNRTANNTNNNRDRDNDLFNVRNGRDDFIDHNGPLTEDYTNDNNQQRDMDTNLFNDNNDNNNNNLRNNNNNNNNLRNNNNDDDTISAYQTNLNSNQYPHTRAVLIRDAKYQYVRIVPGQGGTIRYNDIQHALPNTQQRQTAQAPAGQTGQKQTTQQGQNQTNNQQTNQQTNKEQTAAPNTGTNQNTTTTGASSQFVQQVVTLTNAQRTKNGLPALKTDSLLTSVAQRKSEDMQKNKYFSHTSPTYGSPFDMMRDFGVSYKSAGENIAQGQRSPEEVVNSWMNSEGHRKNILSANFTHIGVGYESTGKHWTQMFIGR